MRKLTRKESQLSSCDLRFSGVDENDDELSASHPFWEDLSLVSDEMRLLVYYNYPLKLLLKTFKQARGGFCLISDKRGHAEALPEKKLIRPLFPGLRVVPGPP